MYRMCHQKCDILLNGLEAITFGIVRIGNKERLFHGFDERFEQFVYKGDNRNSTMALKGGKRRLQSHRTTHSNVLYPPTRHIT